MEKRLHIYTNCTREDILKKTNVVAVSFIPANWSVDDIPDGVIGIYRPYSLAAGYDYFVYGRST